MPIKREKFTYDVELVNQVSVVLTDVVNSKSWNHMNRSFVSFQFSQNQIYLQIVQNLEHEIKTLLNGRLCKFLWKKHIKIVPNTAWNMPATNLRRSKQDKLLEGTFNIIRNNKQKLDAMNKSTCFIDCLKNTHMSECDVVKTMTMCKDCLQRLHDTINENSPKTNSEVKEIYYVVKNEIRLTL